jgi:hypothetical protein
VILHHIFPLSQVPHLVENIKIGGRRYDFGRGVPPEHGDSVCRHNVAAAKGSKGSSKNRDSIAKQMTPEQLAEAQALSAKWFELYQPEDK